MTPARRAPHHDSDLVGREDIALAARHDPAIHAHRIGDIAAGNLAVGTVRHHEALRGMVSNHVRQHLVCDGREIDGITGEFRMDAQLRIARTSQGCRTVPVSAHQCAISDQPGAAGVKPLSGTPLRSSQKKPHR
ncbi:hypothetical protein GMDG_08934 [Pseudogymnoascus destructans 20631-21]|uniref:Uncharacterized protein n=1 Tax=Pseudogymnoascus destructans (strain ATCC MYA-4855 / 20631-21) TaxID=658429 RepID=L8FT89_PSED2|nr:hypothetical protein GMDG_08934 [Pseudogymnoascus destructans 20631-21]